MKKEARLGEERQIEEAKKISVKEAAAYAIMDGFGLRYITPFALSIGASNSQIGLLSSLPSLIGNLSQLLTLKAMEKYSRRKIVFTAVLFQAIMWLFLILSGSLYFIFDIKNKLPSNSIIVIYTLLILFGAFGGPAWNSWMGDLVRKNRGDYFGKRNKIAGFISLICMLLAGFILDYFKKTHVYLGFIIIFSIAFIGRSISAFLFTKQYEPEFNPEKGAYFSIFQFIKKMSSNNFGRFVLYYALVVLTVNIASPFFAVYMIKDLNFNYLSFMLVILGSAVFSFIFMPIWGKFSDISGSLKTMRITGKLTPLVPFLWMLSPLIPSKSLLIAYLVLVEIFSGIIWAGFNLAAGNFIFDAVSRQRVAICTSYFSIIAGIGIFIGAIIGGFVSSLDFNLLGLNPLIWVFILSGIARIMVYLLMGSKIKEVREVKRDEKFYKIFEAEVAKSFKY